MSGLHPSWWLGILGAIGVLGFLATGDVEWALLYVTSLVVVEVNHDGLRTEGSA